MPRDPERQSAKPCGSMVSSSMSEASASVLFFLSYSTKRVKILSAGLGDALDTSSQVILHLCERSTVHAYGRAGPARCAHFHLYSWAFARCWPFTKRVFCSFIVVRGALSRWTHSEFHELGKIHKIHKTVLPSPPSSRYWTGAVT